MLSLHTSASSLSSLNGLYKSGNKLATAQNRLGTGYRINSAMDDAAGLQIATRLKAQSSGIAVAKRNTQNGISMLQAGEGLLEEVGNLLTRMSDLAIQAADGAYSQADRNAMHTEYVALSRQIFDVMNDGTYAGEPLFRYVAAPPGPGGPGTFGLGPVQFQIGDTSDQVITEDFRSSLGAINFALYFAIDDGRLFAFPPDGPGTELRTQTAAHALIGDLARAQVAVSDLRSRFGALSNRLQHTYTNLSNMATNTKAAEGRIMDADYATETATATKYQMLMQSGTAMLKQSNSMSQLVMSLVQ